MAAPKGNLYRLWRDSTPTLPFPFEFNDKQEGKIKQTWQDVRDGMNRDAVNVALAFCVGHFSPSNLQSAIMTEVMTREEKAHKRAQTKATHRLEELRSQSRSSGGGAEVPPSESTPADAHSHEAPPRPATAERMTSEEKAALLAGGRLSYLKLRHRRDTKERFPVPRTTSQNYGWDAHRAASLLRALPPVDNHGAVRKRTCGIAQRSTGVFPHKEFVD